jgi:hypothetical protein
LVEHHPSELDPLPFDGDAGGLDGANRGIGDLWPDAVARDQSYPVRHTRIIAASSCGKIEGHAHY